MDYVTQGTVQVEFSVKTAIDVRINPVQEFTVRYREKDYTVFMTDDPKVDAKAVEKDHAFRVPNTLERVLNDAALKNITVEIKVDFSKVPKIVSVKIPATLRSETV
jgi:hypothetical protein